MYEPPLNPDLVLKAGEASVQECVDKVVAMLADKVCACNNIQCSLLYGGCSS